MTLLWRSQFRFLLRHPLLAALTMLGIALGVAVIHATDIANHSANASLDEAHRELHGFARYRLSGSGRPVAQADYAALRKRWLAQHPQWRLLPVISAPVLIGGERWSLLGVDPVADPRFSPGANTHRNGDSIGARPTGLIGTDSALLSNAAAAALHLGVNDTLVVSVGGRPFSLRVLGIFDDPRGLFARLLITDIGTAQMLLGLPEQLSYIELATETEPDAATRAQLRKELPVGLQLLPGQNLLSGQNTLLDAFQFNLSALSLLALLVGCLLMFSAAQFGFWQRRTLLERLYWLGVSRRQLLRNLLLEAALIAAFACAIGWALGEALSRALLPVAAGTVNELFAAQAIVRAGGAPLDYLKTAALALAAMLGTQGFLFANWRHGATPADESRPRSGYGWALALALLGVGLLLLPGASLAAGFGALFAFAGAWLLLVPEIYRASLGRAALGRASPDRTTPDASDRLRSIPLLTIALRDSRRHYRRLALALAALCLALAAGLGIDVMVDSFRRSLLDWLGQQIAADLYINTSAADSAAVLHRLRENPQVTALSLSRRVALTVDTAPITLQALTLPEQARRRYPLLAVAPGVPDVWQSLQGDAVLVSEPLARKWRLRPGQSLTLPTPQGPRKFLIAAIQRDYDTEYGRVVISTETYHRLWGDTAIDSIGVFATTPAMIVPLEQTLGAEGLVVSDARVIKDEIARLFDRTFVITRLLQLLVSTVALAALISTLLIHQLMQRRQHATLRALGLGRRDLMRLLLMQALPLGLAAGVLALPLGYALAWLLVHEINPRAFGWSLSFHAGLGGAVYTVLLALLLSAVAALYPAWYGARLPIAGELSRE